jgi:hypothetical protein
MTRFLRWAFTGTAGMSAVLCVASCVLWYRSFWPVYNDHMGLIETFFPAGEGTGGTQREIATPT